MRYVRRDDLKGAKNSSCGKSRRRDKDEPREEEGERDEG